MKIKSINPSKNYEVISEVEVSSKQEVENKVELAKDAQVGWQDIGLEKRIAILNKVFLKFESGKEAWAKLMAVEMGMPIKEAREDVEYSIAFLDWYVSHARKYLSPEITFEDEQEVHTVYREPFGVAAVIVPWNFPLSNFVWQCGQNLAAGNSVVFKHSEEVPLFGQKLEEFFNDSILPKGVFNVVHGNGEVGDTLVHQDINLICFTGSTKVGKYLYKVAAENFIPVRMELGGSAPGIIFEDADLEKVIDTVVFNRFMNCGQVCDGLKRLLVHESKVEEVSSMIVDRVKKMKVGDALEEDTDLGPLVAKRQLDLLEEQVADDVRRGANILFGGEKPEGLKGAYYLPTIIDNVDKEMRIWKEEVFGPVLPVVSFSSVEQAIELANDTRYGLGGYIFTENNDLFDKVSKQLRTGMVSQNNVSYIRECNPFGGYKDSGIGREHGKYGFADVTQVKVVSKEK